MREARAVIEFYMVDRKIKDESDCREDNMCFDGFGVD